MPRFHRKTTPGVCFGQVKRKNNWARTPDCYHTPQQIPAIDRKRPGQGYRHLLLKRNIERFVDLLPHWEDVSRGLNVIVLDRGRSDCAGWYNRGVLAVCAFEANLVYELDPVWYASHRDLLTRLGVKVEVLAEDSIIGHWTPSTARAFQLVHVFLHELGHHIDRMTTRPQKWCERGEDYAEQYAWAYEVMVWDRYCDEFGMPE
jgi:hypothetical protein